jgi:predicted ATPase
MCKTMDARKTTSAAQEAVRVGLIADQQQFVPTVADWWWHEWGDSYVVRRSRRALAPTHTTRRAPSSPW